MDLQLIQDKRVKEFGEAQEIYNKKLEKIVSYLLLEKCELLAY